MSEAMDNEIKSKEEMILAAALAASRKKMQKIPPRFIMINQFYFLQRIWSTMNRVRTTQDTTSLGNV